MPSGPFNPYLLQKPKEEPERMLLTAEWYPSAANGGVSGNVIFAGVPRKAMQLADGVALWLVSMLRSGGWTIRVVSKSGAAVPGGGSVGVQSQGGCGSCGVKESEEGVGAVFGTVLGELPSLLSDDSVRAAVSEERDLQENVDEIMKILASAEEAQGAGSGYGGDLDGVEEGKSDMVLITVCSWLDDDGTGYIDMTPVRADGGRSEEQDYDVRHAGGQF
jgi:hypothetical protein